MFLLTVWWLEEEDAKNEGYLEIIKLGLFHLDG